MMDNYEIHEWSQTRPVVTVCHVCAVVTAACWFFAGIVTGTVWTVLAVGTLIVLRGTR